jgi:hypothetical protein
MGADMRGCGSIRRYCFCVVSLATPILSAPVAMAGQTYDLQATNIVIDQPAPLFTTTSVSGFITLADSVAAGAGFGLPSIADFAFDFAGIIVTLADTMLPGGDITAFGQRAADGNSLPFLDLRFDLPPTLPDCGLVCAGQIEIGTFDPSNFVAINDLNADTLSLLSFQAALVPEPWSFPLFGAGLAGLCVARRRRVM